jgi:hypothetical protein
MEIEDVFGSDFKHCCCLSVYLQVNIQHFFTVKKGQLKLNLESWDLSAQGDPNIVPLVQFFQTFYAKRQIYKLIVEHDEMLQLRKYLIYEFFVTALLFGRNGCSDRFVTKGRTKNHSKFGLCSGQQ